MATREFIIDNGYLQEITSEEIITNENVTKDFFNKDFGEIVTDEYYGFVSKLGDCDSSGFVTASYHAVNGIFTISTDDTNVPSYSTLNKKFKLTVNGVVVFDASQTGNFSYTSSVFSKLEDETFKTFSAVLVVSSEDGKQGCVYSYSLDSLERDTIVMSNVDRLFTISYTPTNTFINGDISSVTADWSINPYPDAVVQLPLHTLSYNLTENYLKTLTTQSDVSFKVNVLGKSFGSDGTLTIKSNLYSVTALFNSVINLSNKYVNFTIGGTAPFTLLFIDAILVDNYVDAIVNSGKVLSVMVLDQQVDVDFFTTKGSHDIGDIERYINTVDFNIPVYTLDAETAPLMDSITLGSFVNTSNPLRQTSVPIFKYPQGVTISEVSGEVQSYINNIVSIKDATVFDTIAVKGLTAVSGELVDNITIKRDVGTTTVTTSLMSSHLEELIDNETGIGITSLNDLVIFSGQPLNTIQQYVGEHLTDGGLYSKSNLVFTEFTVQTDSAYYIRKIELVFEVDDLQDVSTNSTILVKAIDSSLSQVKVASCIETSGVLQVTALDTTVSTIYSSYSSKFVSDVFLEADDISGIVLAFKGIGGDMRVAQINIISRKRGL